MQHENIPNSFEKKHNDLTVNLKKKIIWNTESKFL